MKSCSLDDLISVLSASERPRASWRIGAESEKFGVHTETGAPLTYEGEFGVLRIFEWLIAERGWEPVSEFAGGPVIALTKQGSHITLEPGAQLELSGAPLSSVHQVAAEHDAHLGELEAIAEKMGLSWLVTGFHPLARQEELPWVPKQRYAIMREYLPTRGDGALDMMRRTATVQGNFDWDSEADAMQKLRLALKLSPLFNALFANAPFREGRPSELCSLRGEVWLRMDPARSGLIQRVLDNPRAGYADYVLWALEAGMFLVRRDDTILRNTGQTFRDFMDSGFEGHYATPSDFKLHLNTLFPEARLKGTLEVRSIDCVPPDLTSAMLALWTGLLYDQTALDRATELSESWTYEALEHSRPGLVRRALAAPLLGRAAVLWAEEVLDIAEGGLERRACMDERGRSEAALLEPAKRLVSERRCPAEIARERYEASVAKSVAKTDDRRAHMSALIESTRLAIR